MPRRRVLTLEETYTMYCEDCRIQGYKDSTIIGYRRTLRCFLRWATQQRATQVSHFTVELVKRYIAHLQAKQKWSDNDHVPTKPELISATTVRNYVRDLKAFSAWLEREGYTSENVLARVRKPKADEVPISPFSQEELDAIFGVLDLGDEGRAALDAALIGARIEAAEVSDDHLHVTLSQGGYSHVLEYVRNDQRLPPMGVVGHGPGERGGHDHRLSRVPTRERLSVGLISPQRLFCQNHEHDGRRLKLRRTTRPTFIHDERG